MYFRCMLNIKNKADFSFPKQQRITHKKRIAELFEKGISAKAYPFRAKFLPNAYAFHRVLIAVPKRNVPLASNRNHIKRLMREAFRLHQHQLKTSPQHIDLLFIFNGKKKPTYDEVEKKLIQLFKTIQTQLTSAKNH